MDLKVGGAKWHAARVDEVVGAGSDEFVLERVKLTNLKSRVSEWYVIGAIAQCSPARAMRRACRAACLCAVSGAHVFLFFSPCLSHDTQTLHARPATCMTDGSGSTSTMSEL